MKTTQDNILITSIGIADRVLEQASLGQLAAMGNVGYFVLFSLIGSLHTGLVAYHTDDWKSLRESEFLNGFAPPTLEELTVQPCYNNLYHIEGSYESPFNCGTLRYVTCVLRIGTRTPLTTYPTDPYPYYDLKYWPEGVGSLTKVGIQESYVLGKRFRELYSCLLQCQYSVNDTEAVSLNNGRDFETAAAVLAGLYPPSSYQDWNPYIPWQPIQISYFGYDYAHLIVNATLCPKFTAESNRILSELNANNTGLASLYHYLSSYTGSNITEYSDFYNIFDSLEFDAKNGYPLPSWAKYIFPSPLTQLYSKFYATILAGTPELARLTGGSDLYAISEQLSAKAYGTMNPNYKFRFYAARNATITSILFCLGFQWFDYVDLTATLFFELHQYEKLFYVQVLYLNNSATTTPTVLQIPGCESPCSLANFNYIALQSYPTNWTQECLLT